MNLPAFQRSNLFALDPCACYVASVVSNFCNPMDSNLPGASVHVFSRQEYWNGLLCPPSGYLPNPGIKPRSLSFQRDSLSSEPSGKLSYSGILFSKNVKEESEKVGLKLHIQKMKIMASGPITSWQIHGETVEQCPTLFLGAPKSLQMVIVGMKLKDAYSLEGKLQPT